MQTQQIDSQVQKDDSLSDYHVKFISNFIYQRSGIVLGESKKHLIESRLHSVARISGLRNLTHLCDELSANSRQLETLVLNALTTSETSWFRDSKPFETLVTKIFPQIKRNRSTQTLQIWSAACSTGQEAYSIAIKILEWGLFSDWHVRIVATDISSNVLEQAEEGLYSQLEISRGLPIKFLVRYFSQIGDVWKIKPEVRKMVSFREHVLQNDATALGTFDLVFCRNVLLYFDFETKGKIFDNICRTMTEDGLLALGSSETTLNITPLFEPIKLAGTVFYAKADANHGWKELAD